MRRYLIVAALLALALPTVATAKGPVSAFISGPGLQRGLEISGDGETVGTPHWATSRTRAASSHRCSGSPRPDVRDPAKWQARLRYKVVYVLPRTERHLESRRPARLSLCAAACAHVHEAGAGVLRHRAESRGLVPRVSRAQEDARPGRARGKSSRERLRVRALRPTRVAVLAGVAAALLPVAAARPAASASEIRVPEDAATLQLAIARAQPGDTIVLAAGTYAGGNVVPPRSTTSRSGASTAMRSSSTAQTSG